MISPISSTPKSATVFYWLPVVAWMAAILVVPGLLNPIMPLPHPKPDLLSSATLVRSAIHAGEYGVLALLLLRAFAHRRFGITPGTRLWEVNRRFYHWAFWISVVYGLLDEIQQGFIPTRQPSVVDVLANSVGALVFLTGLAVISARGDRLRLSSRCGEREIG